MISIVLEPPDQPEVAALLTQADALSASLYPPESNHPVYADVLGAANARFFVARQGGMAVGCGAVILGPDGHGEIKRMFVDPARRGQGVGRQILAAIEAAAVAEGAHLLQLETGVDSHDALRLYHATGFVERGPFGGYRPDPLSVFMEKVLA